MPSPPAVTGRRRWHPLTLAAVIGAAAAVAGALQLVGTGPLATGSLWLAMGAAAGYATSGSV